VPSTHRASKIEISGRIQSLSLNARSPDSLFTLREYKHILTSALRSGYECIRFSQIGDYRRHEGLLCCLRHDCDNDLVAAAAMASLEEKMRIRSTYFLMVRSAMYNILSIPNAKLVREIIAAGHEIGCHFDEQRYPGTTPAQMSACVDWERRLLSHEFGVPVDVISFHQPSKMVLENRIEVNCINTYNRKDMDGFHYISDSNTVWKEGNPIVVFRDRTYPKLQLLTHPEWWTPDEMPLRQKWNRMLRNNFELVQQSLLRRERAYTQRQEIGFRIATGRKPVRRE